MEKNPIEKNRRGKSQNMPAACQLIKFASDWLNFHGEKIKFVTSEYQGLSKVLEESFKNQPILPPVSKENQSFIKIKKEIKPEWDPSEFMPLFKPEVNPDLAYLKPVLKPVFNSQFKPEFKPLTGTNRVQLRPLSNLQASAFQVNY